MLRRSFLQLLGAAAVAPLVTPFEVLAPVADAPVIIAVEASTPYWLLELKAMQRLYNKAWSDYADGSFPQTQSGRAWTPTFPTHPKVDA